MYVCNGTMHSGSREVRERSMCHSDRLKKVEDPSKCCRKCAGASNLCPICLDACDDAAPPGTMPGMCYFCGQLFCHVCWVRMANTPGLDSSCPCCRTLPGDNSTKESLIKLHNVTESGATTHRKAWAHYNIAVYYDADESVRNLKLAAHHYTIADKLGVLKATANLGMMIVNQRFPAGDMIKGVELVRDAAHNGISEAQVVLGKLYAEKSNHLKAVKWYRRAADNGYADGQFMLGDCLRHGKGLTANKTEALRMYLSAAIQGLPEAETNAGRAYMSGSGVSANTTIGARWFRKAAEKGFVHGQTALAKCYLNGTGMPQSTSLALEWYNAAAAQGSGLARKCIQMYFS